MQHAVLVTLHLVVHIQVSYAKCCSSLFAFNRQHIIQPSNTNMNCCHTTHGTTHPTHSTGQTTHGTRTVSPANSCSSLFTTTAKVQTKVDHSNSKVAFTSHHSPDTNLHQTTYSNSKCQEIRMRHL